MGCGGRAEQLDRGTGGQKKMDMPKGGPEKMDMLNVP